MSKSFEKWSQKSDIPSMTMRSFFCFFIYQSSQLHHSLYHIISNITCRTFNMIKKTGDADDRIKCLMFALQNVLPCVFNVSGVFHKSAMSSSESLTHWGRVTHICVSKLASIASDHGLSPGRRQAIIRNIAGIILIGPFGTTFSEISIEIQTFWRKLKKIRLKMSSAKCRPFCLGLNVLMHIEMNGGGNFCWNTCNVFTENSVVRHSYPHFHTRLSYHQITWSSLLRNQITTDTINCLLLHMEANGRKLSSSYAFRSSMRFAIYLQLFLLTWINFNPRVIK